MKAVSCFLVYLLTIFFSATGATSYVLFEDNGKVGLKNDHGQILIPAQYQALGWSDGNLSVVNNVTGYKVNGLWGLINLSNHKVTQPTFEEILPGEGSYLIARKKTSYSFRHAAGIISTDGKEIVPFQYDGIHIESLRAIVYTKIGNEYKYGLIDLDNKTIVPQQFKGIRSVGSLRYAVENFDHKTAIYTDAGKQITGFIIDSISIFKKNYAIIYQNLQQGLIDREGNMKLEAKYREIKIDEAGNVMVRQPNDWTVLDGQNKLVRQIFADDVEPIGKNRIKISISGATYLADETFAPINHEVFNAIKPFENNKAVFIRNNHAGLLHRDGHTIVQPVFDELRPDGDITLARKKNQGKDRWTMLDSMGIQKSQKAYDVIVRFNKKYFSVKQHGRWGLMNIDGKETLNCSYDSILPNAIADDATNTYVVVKFQNQFGIVSFSDEWKLTPRAHNLTLIDDQHFIESTGKTTYLKSIEGGVIYFTDNPVEIFSDHLIETLPSGTQWKIDLDGRIADRKVVPEEPVQQIFEESEGLRGIQKNGQFGFVDSRGRLRIANRYDGIQKFSEGLAAIKIRGKWGFINHQDNIAIQPVYETVTAFQNGTAAVTQKGMHGIINKQGQVLLPVRYDSVSLTKSAHLLIRQEKLFGLADMQGKILIQPRYQLLKDVGDGYAIISRDGKFGVVTLQSISTIPLIFDFISFDPYHKHFLAVKKSQWISAELK